MQDRGAPASQYGAVAVEKLLFLSVYVYMCVFSQTADKLLGHSTCFLSAVFAGSGFVNFIDLSKNQLLALLTFYGDFLFSISLISALMSIFSSLYFPWVSFAFLLSHFLRGKP